MSQFQRFLLLLLFTKSFFCAQVGHFGFDEDDVEANAQHLIGANQPADQPVVPVAQNDSTAPNFHLPEQVFDFGLSVNEEPIKIFQPFPEDIEKLNFDLILRILNFLFLDNYDHQELAQIYHILGASKTLNRAGELFILMRLSPFKFAGKSPQLNSALLVALSGLENRFPGLLNRPIEIKDLLEISMAAKFDDYDDPVLLRAFEHLHNSLHGTESSARQEFDFYRLRANDPLIWLPRASDRIFRFNQLPYAAEIYLTSGLLTPFTYFNGILDISNEKVLPFLRRILAHPEASSLLRPMISSAVERRNLVVLNFLLDKVEGADTEFITQNAFLVSLVSGNVLYPRLLEMSRGNDAIMDRSLKAALSNKNLGIFTALLDAYDFGSLKWHGCKYLLSRRDDHQSSYDHDYFVKTFVADNADNDIFPLLMPIFNLSQVHFKEIFRKLVNINVYDFMESQKIESSLIYHVATSTEDYFRLLPKDVTFLFINYSNRLSHIKDIVHFTPERTRNHLIQFKNPLDLLYFSTSASDLNILTGCISLFNLNRHHLIKLDQIALTPILPNNLNFLRQVNEWTLIHLAIVFQLFGLIELILNQPSFNRAELKFQLGERIDAVQLIDELIRFQSESPYLFPYAHQLEELAEKYNLY